MISSIETASRSRIHTDNLRQLDVSPFSVSASLLRHACVSAPSQYIGKIVDLMTGCSLVTSVYERIEGAKLIPSVNTQTKDVESYGAFDINPTYFTRDGILMTAGSVMGHLLRHVLAEVRRRGSFGTSSINGTATDMDNLVLTLQRSENHFLVGRVLLSSWHQSESKKQVIVVDILVAHSANLCLGITCLYVIFGSKNFELSRD